MQLFYDPSDFPDAKKLKDERFIWLMEIDAIPLNEARPDSTGFLFGYQHGESHLMAQVGDRPGIHDRPHERQELVNLDNVMRA